MTIFFGEGATFVTKLLLPQELQTLASSITTYDSSIKTFHSCTSFFLQFGPFVQQQKKQNSGHLLAKGFKTSKYGKNKCLFQFLWFF